MVASATIMVSLVINSVPFGPDHMMEISLDLTPSTVTISHIKENTCPPVILPSVITFTNGVPRSRMKDL